MPTCSDTKCRRGRARRAREGAGGGRPPRRRGGGGAAGRGGARAKVGVVAVPVLVLTGLAFAALGLAVNALASGYDFFSYYPTLVLTPMMMLSGGVFSVGQV